MKIVIINGSARKGNTLAAINAFIKGASEKNKIEIIRGGYLVGDVARAVAAGFSVY